ncbi:MAG: hypothetical protein WC457_04775 [Patescibacteria group bacterium]
MQKLIQSGNELTREDWIKLVEEKARLVRPFLELVTLPKLGDIRCMGRRDKKSEPEEYYPLESFADCPIVSSNGSSESHSLRTQGIFEWFVPRLKKVNEIYVYGLSRNGGWSFITVHYEIKSLVDMNGSGLKYSQVATQLFFEKISFGDMLDRAGADPADWWRILSQTVSQWLADKEKQLARIQRLHSDNVFADKVVMSLRGGKW